MFARLPAGGRLSVAGALLVPLVATAAPAHAAVDNLVATWGVDGPVYALLTVGDTVYVGGQFANVIDANGVSHPAANVAAYKASTGAFDLGFVANTNGVVSAFATTGGNIYIGGDFTTVNGTNRSRVAAVNPTTGALNKTFKANANRLVDTLAVADGKLFMGGRFTTVSPVAGKQTRNYVAKVDPATGALDAWSAAPNARVRAMSAAPDGSRVYIAGDFTTVNGSTAQQMVSSLRTDTGAVASGFAPGNTSAYGRQPVFDIVATPDNRVLLAAAGSGGGCTSMNATTGAQQWTKSANGNMQAVSYIGNVVWCGGHFGGEGGFGGQERYKLATVSRTTGADLGFAERVNNPYGVWALTTASDRTYVAGEFTSIGNVDIARFAAFMDTQVFSAPGAPGTPTAVGGNASVSLSWGYPASDGNAAITSYAVHRSDNGGPYAQVGTSTTTSFTDASVTNGTPYSYYVTATNSVGAGPASPSVDVTPYAIGNGLGLQASYFNNSTLSGTPGLTRVEAPGLNVPAGAVPVSGFPSSLWTTRWSGTITAPVSGTYSLQTVRRSDDGVRVWVDNVLVIDNWTGSTTTRQVDVALTANTPRQIRVEFIDWSDAATLTMSWRMPGQSTYSPIPTGVFNP